MNTIDMRNNFTVRNISKNNSKEYSHQLVIETNGLIIHPHDIVYIRRAFCNRYNIKLPADYNTIYIDSRNRTTTS